MTDKQIQLHIRVAQMEFTAAGDAADVRELYTSFLAIVGAALQASNDALKAGILSSVKSGERTH